MSGRALLLVGALAGFAAAEDAPRLRLLLLRDGYRTVAPGRDLTRFRGTHTYEVAKKAGADLEKPRHPLLFAQYREGRLYYIFYKTVENAFGDRPYVIQRIRKTQRTWKEAGAEPETKVTYQVEVFKTYGGAVKRADQHYGSYGLGDHIRREIVKEYEIGFGEVPGKCEGTDWPFSPGKLFRYLQRYQEEPGVYDEVVFRTATPWTLHVSFDADGKWSVACPQLGFDAPGTMPDPQAHAPAPIDGSDDVVLAAGGGAGGARFGESDLADLERRFGGALSSTGFANGTSAHSFANGLTCNLDGSGRLHVVSTRPGFAGRTRSGIRHGDSRGRVLEVHGVPEDQPVYGWTWSYPGVRYWFDGFERVSRISVREAR